MSKRARHRFTIDVLDGEGAGVGAPEGLGGRRLHVPFTLPGEEVVAEVEHESPHRPEAWGRLVELVRPSSERVEAPCPAWGRCGGCAVQHLEVSRQRAWKRTMVEEALAASGVAAPVGECLGVSPARPYRNRSKLVFARDPRVSDRVILGAYAPRSHRVVDLAGCAVVVPPIDAIAGVLARLATELGIRPYDERSGEGDARYAILRAGRDGATQVMLVVARRGGHHIGHPIGELARRLAAERPEVRGIVENLQPARSNALIGDVEPDRVLIGEPDLVERVGDPDGVTLHLGPRAFFQASWPGADLLYRLAVDRADLRAGETALDLYCGVGGIALLAARRVPSAQLIGVEEVPDAVVDAERARAAMAIGNARFVAADAAAFLDGEAAALRPSVVFVDPPRRGLSSSVVKALIRLAPRRIVYVSCAPDTLARDLALFLGAGYRAGEVTPIDLMPDTAHVESVVALAAVGAH